MIEDDVFKPSLVSLEMDWNLKGCVFNFQLSWSVIVENPSTMSESEMNVRHVKMWLHRGGTRTKDVVAFLHCWTSEPNLKRVFWRIYECIYKYIYL